MFLRRAKRPPRPKSLGKQKTDFTAEGSPPPGKVANEAPVTNAVPSPAPKCPLQAKPR